jgi:hypothetical protein
MIATRKPLTPLARRWHRLGAVIALALAAAAPTQAQDAAALQAREAALHEALARNAYGRPLVLESSEGTDNLRGDIYARIERPFAAVGASLQGIDHWCEILMLHLNTQACRAIDSPAGEALELVIGQKHNQPMDQAYRFEFAYKLVASRPDYLQVLLAADAGPLGTKDYRIVLEVAALDSRNSFVHMSYAYGQGVMARIALQGYLATLGRNKVGFSVVGRQADGQPQFIAGTRGVIERNTMRYYLAVEAYLGALSSPPALRFEKRLADWHAGIERYPVQLHELELGEYLALKRRQAGQPLALAR